MGHPPAMTGTTAPDPAGPVGLLTPDTFRRVVELLEATWPTGTRWRNVEAAWHLFAGYPDRAVWDAASKLARSGRRQQPTPADLVAALRRSGTSPGRPRPERAGDLDARQHPAGVHVWGVLEDRTDGSQLLLCALCGTEVETGPTVG